MPDLTPDLAELRRLAELANDLPAGSDWLHGEVGDGTETVAEWMEKCSANPDAPAAGLLHVVWSEGSGEKPVIIQAIVGDTAVAPIRAAFMANANPAVILALLDAAGRLADVEAERDALAAKVAAVREWHVADEAPLHGDDGKVYCGRCWDFMHDEPIPWPCPTTRALDGTEGDRG